MANSKSITIFRENLHQCFDTLAELGISLTSKAATILAPLPHIHIPLETIKRLIADDLEEKTVDTSVSTVQEPERIIELVQIPSKEKRQLEALRSQFIIDWKEAEGKTWEQEQISHNYQISKGTIRHKLALKAAEEYVNPEKTLIYGGGLQGAKFIAPNGSPRECHTLIHLTTPISPEDWRLREVNVKCDRIVLIQVVQLDDAAIARMDQPLYWPMGVKEWRELLEARHESG